MEHRNPSQRHVPGTLAEIGRRAPKDDLRGAPAVRGTQYGRAVLANALDRIEIAPGGFRHREVFAAAAAVGNLIASEIQDEVTATSMLTGQAQAIGLPRRDAERTVRNGIERGKRTPKTAPTNTRVLRNATEARFAVIEWWESVRSHEWKGRTAATDLRILSAFCDKALTAGKLTLNESFREIALAAGVSTYTVAKRRHSWGRFVGLVQKGSRRDGTRSTWQLITRRKGGAKPNNPVGNPVRDNPDCLETLARPTDPSIDYWHGWSTGWRLYDLLLAREEGITAREVADVLGVHVTTARSGLRRLKSWGLASHDDDRCWVALKPTAEEPGFHRNRRRKAFEAERELWRQNRAYWLREEERSREQTTPVGASLELRWGVGS